MKVTFIVVYSSTEPNTIYDPKSWPHRDRELEDVILEGTLSLLNQISTIPIDKEILLMDNSGDFPDDFHCDDLKVVKAYGSWSDIEMSENKFIFDSIDDIIPDKMSNSNATTSTSLAFQHGVILSTGDYIIMQHNDTEYLFDYYDKAEVILDAIELLEKNNYEYITIDKKRIKNKDYIEWNDKIEYYADCYWFLCKSDFYKKHNIWVDWTRGDTNHLSTITCVNKGLKFLHLPFFYEGDEILIENDTKQKLIEFNSNYPELKTTGKNYHLLNDIPFLAHCKGGTGLRRFLRKNR
jgi:hypothetical protein